MAQVSTILLPAQRLRQAQEQALSLQTQERMKLLALPLPELRTALRQSAEQNPFLEYEPCAPTVSLDEALDQARREADEGEQLDYYNSSLEGFGDQMDAVDRSELERQQDWRILNLTEPETLYRHLARQVEEQFEAGWQRELLLFICDALDTDGYLRVSSHTLLQDWWGLWGSTLPQSVATEAAIAKAIRQVQQLDPVGVGARSLGECLALQVKADTAYREERGLYLKLCHQLDLVLTLSQERLAKRLGCTLGALQDALAYLRGLDPFPGRQFATREPLASPEVVALPMADGTWRAVCEIERFPLFRVDEGAVAQARTSALSREEQRVVESFAGDARRLVEAYHERNDTLERIAQLIFDRQPAFLASGGDATTLRPLLQCDIAKAIGYDESTVSRALKDKYVRLPTTQKLLPLKAFFTRQGVSETMTEVQLKEALRRLIEAEDARHPLSDQALADALAKEGVPLARRTVTKYREALGIPSTRERKQRFS